ncbi:hypothetical protein SAY86_019550 [Trapa natans]|uniref:Cytochrome P450 n=1 Tax=Trapa natans TaxID=22666 RepID=A0AAN7LL72_TRANT|nr:hypothetical protein SAY86_019550 [Trapa natans]
MMPFGAGRRMCPGYALALPAPPRVLRGKSFMGIRVECSQGGGGGPVGEAGVHCRHEESTASSCQLEVEENSYAH